MSITTTVPETSAGFKVPNSSSLHKIKHFFNLTTSYEDYALSDLGNARFFATVFREILRYNLDTERWLAWSGHTWRELYKDEILDFASLFLDLQLHQINQRTSSSPEALKYTAMLRAANAKFQSADRIRGMLKLAASQPCFRTTNAQWNANDYLLGAENGVLDLKSGEFGPGKLRDYISKAVPVTFDPAASCPVFDKFIHEILPDNDDRNFVQRALGYSLTGNTNEQVLFFALGEGSNGKSKLLECVAEVMGPYSHCLNLAALDDRNSSSIPNDLAQLGGKRFVLGSETKSSARFNEAKVKMLTGETKISVRFLHKEFFNLRNQSHFWAGVNHLPAVQDATDGYWRRVRIIEFNKKISEEQMDKALPEKLWAERAGILRWLLAGCMEWQRIGLATPQHVKDRVKMYRDDNDRTAQFLEHRTFVAAGAEVGMSCLYEEFEKYWKTRYHEECPPFRIFNALIKKRGFETKKNNVMVWMGLGLVML